MDRLMLLLPRAAGSAILAAPRPILGSRLLTAPLSTFTRVRSAGIPEEGSFAAKPVLDFSNTKDAFKYHSTLELLRSVGILKLCSFNFLTSNSETIVRLCRKYLGVRGTSLIFLIFYKQFAGGESRELLAPTLKRLEKAGLGAILDYAAEEDLSDEAHAAASQPSSPPVHRPVLKFAVSPIYVGPAPKMDKAVCEFPGDDICDKRAAVFREAIDAAGTQTDGFAALKVTALIDPAILIKFGTLAGTLVTALPRSIGNAEQYTLPQLEAVLANGQLRKASKATVKQIFDQALAPKSDKVDAVSWMRFWDDHLFDDKLLASCGVTPLSREDKVQIDLCLERLDTLAAFARQLKVRLMIDAEQTYFQPGIDWVVRFLQARYNSEFPAIFNTFQCYLRDTRVRLQNDMILAERLNFIPAMKLVRGAYMHQERLRAKELSYSDPIQPDINSTHQNYNQCVDDVLQQVKKGANLMVASHNENSILHTISAMDKLKIGKRDGVFFGQLLGMTDHVSFALGTNKYAAYKYVPYGNVYEVVAYLTRRIQENSSLSGGEPILKARELLRNELKRRFFG